MTKLIRMLCDVLVQSLIAWDIDTEIDEVKPTKAATEMRCSQRKENSSNVLCRIFLQQMHPTCVPVWHCNERRLIARRGRAPVAGSRSSQNH